MKTDLYGLFVDEIAAVILPYGLEKYRGGQIAEWLYHHGIVNFMDMTNIPLEKRRLLADHFSILPVGEQTVRHSADGRTSKYLLAFADGAAVETVLMRQSYGNSVCISTQVGCEMGCQFCASSLLGKSRDLLAAEMVRQVLYIQGVLAKEKRAIHSLVIMGTGEPLANYENVLRFIRLCHEKYCLNLGYRNITLSTVGLVPEIDQLATEGLPVTLSVSLHAPNNAIRSKLMPVNNRYPLEMLLAAASRYSVMTGRRVTYEYILLDGINCRPEHARELASLLRGRLANVNLIPANPVPERGFLRPDALTIKEFAGVLEQRGITATVRREMGADIQAACGQLRHQLLRDSSTDNFD
jgi:23S rRNA (adenine2503-C2)-methyltransferase